MVEGVGQGWELLGGGPSPTFIIYGIISVINIKTHLFVFQTQKLINQGDYSFSTSCTKTASLQLKLSFLDLFPMG